METKVINRNIYFTHLSFFSSAPKSLIPPPWRSAMTSVIWLMTFGYTHRERLTSCIAELSGRGRSVWWTRRFKSKIKKKVSFLTKAPRYFLVMGVFVCVSIFCAYLTTLRLLELMGAWKGQGILLSVVLLRWKRSNGYPACCVIIVSL